MFSTFFLNRGTKAKAVISLLFVAAFSLTGHAQEEKKNPIVEYGEQHQAVFIGAILVGVAILVGIVALIFRKSIRQESTPTAPATSGGFSKPTQRAGKQDDRRYGTRKTMPQNGGFTRR